MEIYHTRDILGRKCVIDCRGCEITKAIQEAVDAERKRCVGIAQHATMPPYSFEVHPDIPFDQFNEWAKTAGHSVAQGIAMEIQRSGSTSK